MSIRPLPVTAIICVNALGDVIDKDGKILAGAKGKDGEFINTSDCLLNNRFGTLLFGNTTIGCILTNAKLDKLQANKIASVAHNGLAKSISPVHTDYDGDTLFCMATGKVPVLNLVLLQTAVVEAVENAVRAAVRSGENYTVICEEEEISE